jgi:uncharacterized protein YcbK (DUF882 family)
MAAAVLIIGCEGLQNAVAEGDTRTISLHHVHTNEDLTITYKRDGRYDADALKKINWILRDWRRNEEIATDPRLIDLVWEVQREVGAKQPIHIICGYRAPQTNAMLRRKSDGVAQFSQHTLGKAMDFFIPGVPLEQLRNMGLRAQRGGIGFYPTSGSPFVHLDVGSVRHWPSISRDELVRIFPDGRTVHVPSDGHPLPGYALARADIERRGGQPSSVSMQAARSAGVLIAQRDRAKPGNALAKFFGFGKDANEDVETTAAIAAPSSKPTPSVVAKMPAKPVELAAAGPSNPPKEKPAQFASVQLPWPLSPSPLASLPEQALAYAPLPGPELTTRRAPAPPPRAAVSRPAPLAASAPAFIPPETSIVVRQADGMPAVVHTRRLQTGEAFDDPWMRAAILAPDLRHYMTVTSFGAQDYRGLDVFMRKPSSSVTMSFSDDPNPGLLAERFSGQAVVFVATTPFNARTASLQ